MSCPVMNNCLVKLLLLLINLRHGIIAPGCDSDSFLIASVKLLILHLLGLSIVWAGLLGMLSCLMDLPLNFHLFLFRHALFGCEMLELIIIISGSSLRWPLTDILLLLELLDWLHNWSVLDINSIWSPNRHTTRIHEFDHLLADNRHLKDLGHRGPFLGVFI